MSVIDQLSAEITRLSSLVIDRTLERDGLLKELWAIRADLGRQGANSDVNHPSRSTWEMANRAIARAPMAEGVPATLPSGHGSDALPSGPVFEEERPKWPGPRVAKTQAELDDDGGDAA